MNSNSRYIIPSVEIIEIIAEGSLFAQSNLSIGIGGWDETGEDLGGSAE